MKRVLIAGLLMVPLWLGATTLTTEESVSMEVEPDAMQTRIGFEEQGMQQSAIRAHFNTLLQTIKRHDGKKGMECRGGGMRIAPSYRWVDNRQQSDGYRGSMEATCTFKDIDAFNALSKELETAAKAYRDLKLRQEEIVWIVTPEAARRNAARLEDRLIKKIRQRESRLSESMGQQCRADAIALGSARHQRPPVSPVAEAKMMHAAVPVEAPIEARETQSLEATVTFRCD